MKVWELIAALSQFKANATVVVSMRRTDCTSIEEVEMIDDETIEVIGGDAHVLDEDGNEASLLTEIEFVDE